MNKEGRMQNLIVNAKVNKRGVDIVVNNDVFPIIYPDIFWQEFPDSTKEMLSDNLALSSTMFLPQMHNLPVIKYGSSRPLCESFLFKNGIFDMPSSAVTDGKSSFEYIKKFFNTRYEFRDNNIKHLPNINLVGSQNSQKTAIILFSFGKESLLNYGLAKELGWKTILVNIIEPSHTYEYAHKQKLIKEFEQEFGETIYNIEYHPGHFRYGRYWDLKTELGWGLHVTEYVILLTPLISQLKPDYLILGNEVSCNDTSFDQDGVLIYESAYDQHRDWTAQQGFLVSLLSGHKIEAISLVEPLYEIAEMKILHKRYPHLGKYQMSCFADNEHARDNRWCQDCVKCAYTYLFLKAFGVEPNKLGFDQDMLSVEKLAWYDNLFNQDPAMIQYASGDELAVALYLAAHQGGENYLIKEFKEKLGDNFLKNKKEAFGKYFKVYPTSNLPVDIEERVKRIFQEEMAGIGN